MLFQIIPNQFVNLYLRPIPHTVILQANDGLTWPVEITELHDVVEMGKGWASFRDFYKLGLIDVAVFTLVPINMFLVTLFDFSSKCEVETAKLHELVTPINLAREAICGNVPILGNQVIQLHFY